MGKPNKEPWDKRVGEAIGKFFRVLRSVGEILYKIAQQTIETINYIVTITIKLVINPSASVFFCLGVLGFITAVTAFQWWEVGVWLGSRLELQTLLGWGLGTLGIVVGLFLNIEELSPELHKIHESLARAYDKMGVKFDFTPDESDIKDRVANWFSYDMSLAKKGRWTSYAVETAIVVPYMFLTGLTFQTVAIGFVALACPELSVKYLSSKTSLFGTATALANQIENESGSTRNFGGSSKGGVPSMDFPGGSGGGKKDRF